MGQGGPCTNWPDGVEGTKIEPMLSSEGTKQFPQLVRCTRSRLALADSVCVSGRAFDLARPHPSSLGPDNAAACFGAMLIYWSHPIAYRASPVRNYLVRLTRFPLWSATCVAAERFKAALFCRTSRRGTCGKTNSSCHHGQDRQQTRVVRGSINYTSSPIALVARAHQQGDNPQS